MTRFGIDELRQRVTEAIEKEGLRSFARRASVGIGVVRSVSGGRDPSFSNAYALASAVGLDLGFGAIPEPPAIDAATESDFAQVPLYKVWLAAGAGVENRSEEVIDYLAFRRNWLRRIDVSPSNARLVRVIFDSMEPTIWAGDVVLVDISKNALPTRIRSTEDKRQPPIYALLDGDQARVKRVEMAGDEEVLLISDNKFHPTEKRSVRDISLIGRVLWWGHTVEK